MSGLTIKRKRDLIRYAYREAGQWLASDADAADCFDDLKPDEEDFVREYIRMIAESMIREGKAKP